MIKKMKKSLEKRALPVMILTVFIDVLGVGILIPVLPQLVFNIFIPAGFTRTEGFIALGWLSGIYPLMQFISTPILGQLSDRYGRKKILGISLFGTAVGYALFAVAIITKNIPLLFFSRALDGITGGNLSVAQAVIADVTPPQKRTKSFALIGAMFGLGFVLGPYIGARLSVAGISFFGLFNTPSWFTTSTPFWFTGILSLINVLLVMFILPETNDHINNKLKMVWSKSVQNIVHAATSKNLRYVFMAVFLFWSGFAFFQTFFQIYLKEKLGFSTNNIGDFFAYIGLWIAVTQAAITPFISKKLKNYQVLKFSLIGNGIALFLQLLPHNTTQLLFLAPFIALFNGLTIANTTALVSNSAGKELQGEVLGINASVQALAGAIPAIMAGYIATLGINMPVIVGGSVIIVGGLLYIALYRPSKEILHEDAPVVGIAH